MVEISELVAQELRAPFFKGPYPSKAKPERAVAAWQRALNQCGFACK